MQKRTFSFAVLAAATFLCAPVARAAVHDASADFSLDSNPSPTGWGYDVGFAAGGGPVGDKSDNWNQGDFGPGQPGWLGPSGAAHAGWAKRVDNCDGGANTAPVCALAEPQGLPGFDAPVGTIMTHGPTSLAWTAPANDTDHYATISGGVWNLRHFGRSGTWSIYKNSTLLTQGSISDTSGTSSAPTSFDTGSAGPLTGIRYEPGDIFRYDTDQNDFHGVQFVITTSNVGPDPDITTQPTDQHVSAGATVTLNVIASGTAPLAYQWKINGNDVSGANVSGATTSTLTIQNATPEQSGIYTVVVSNSKGSKTSTGANVAIEQVTTGNVHDLAADFTLAANPSLSGWQYSRAVADGGGIVNPVTQSWNQGDFGPGQPGWEGATPPGGHAGWAKRVDNCPNDSAACGLPYDAPPGSILTHGPTSVLWKVPANDPNRFANITGNVWNLRPFGRSGQWRIYKENADARTLLTSGTVSDASSSSSPITFDTGSGGVSALQSIPYVPGDAFRFETTEGDFQGVNFTITTSNVGPDPDIATQPQGKLIAAGGTLNLSVAASGTQPLSYQWQLNGQDVPGATSATLDIQNITPDKGGAYTVVVSNSKGSKTSKPASVVVDSVAAATPGVHDLASDFTFQGNPTARGWEYDEALSGGGGRVATTANLNWNEATFGPGQPGYDGIKVGTFAGWAQRVNNGTLDSFDAPVDTVLTHGPTSVKYAIQSDEPFHFANITGNLWSAERNNRGQGWKIWKNDNILLAEGVFSGGTSDAPNAFETAQGSTVENLSGIPIKPGDTFRLEILPTSGPGGQLQGPYGDFVGVNFKISTTDQGPDPAIATQPLNQVAVEGTDVSLKVVPVGTGPFTYQWQLEGNPISGQTTDTLSLPAIALTQAGHYTVVVTNSKGSITSIPATVTVTPKPPTAHGTRYDLADDFSLEANPTPKGWQYSESSVIFPPGDPVGPESENWNQPDFGPGQPGWLGKNAGVHAGWAKRVQKAPSGAPGDSYDWPVGVVLTHGPTSVKWTAPADLRPGSVADISGGLWNVRHLNRGSLWHIFKNDVEIITEGEVNDHSGDSKVPENFTSGSGGPNALKNIPLQPGDSLRFEIAGNPSGGAYDFVAVNFTITVRVEHDASAEFDSAANPSPSGWQYSESVANGGGVVGAFSPNWNQPDFGAGQPGWLGAIPGAHAGWAKRIDNGNDTPTFDDPVGTIITHGPTSIMWKAPTADPGGLASISGGVWNIRHLGRSGTWNLYKNGTVLTSGALNDNSGTSTTPFAFSRGSAGDVLTDIPYKAGDEFRLEILQGDFTGVKFDISTYPSGIIDPEIKTQPADLTVVEGSDAVFSVAATGSQPLTYQWQFKGNSIQNATGSTLTIPAADAADAGNYTVIVTSPAGSATSRTAVLTVISVPGTVRQGGSGADGLAVLEAEHYNQKIPGTPAGAGAEISWTEVTDPAGFSGTGAMQALPNSGININTDVSASPRMDYKVNFPQAGTYYIWVRGLADSTPGLSVDDSVNIGLDNTLPSTSDRISVFPQDGGYVWSNGLGNGSLDNAPATFIVPNPGTHVVNVWMREDGFIIDKLLLTLDSTFTPTGIGPVESPVVGGGGAHLTISSSNGNITIAWDAPGTLMSSDIVNGTYTPVAGATGQSFQTTASAAAKFYQVK